jgi:hypothetical protein
MSLYGIEAVGPLDRLDRVGAPETFSLELGALGALPCRWLPVFSFAPQNKNGSGRAADRARFCLVFESAF